MRRLINASFVLATVFLCLAGYGQQNGRPNGTPKDRFLGKWILNAAKSTLPPAGSTIAVDFAGNKYKISLYVIDEHGTEFRSWTVTNMKGTWSNVTKLYGRTSPRHFHENWRVTREGPGAFVVESAVDTRRYAVSSDGKTMTEHLIKTNITTYDGPTNPTKGSVKTVEVTYPVLVYDKTDE